ncbi:MAG: cupredoxin domain-containing protein [Candidatus Liptonbacteria bacterium]|nr:cupredoxin domain-containing protein [Candidatus Liptonbacteria bacterium]
MDQILVTLIGLLGISFTYWYFLGKREKTVVAGDAIDIVVEGGYSPDVISVKQGKLTRLNFLRRDTNSCLEEVVLPDFKIRKTLPLNQKVTVEIIPKQAGQYSFSCGMGMYHGKIIVSDGAAPGKNIPN